jgi:hypothetical protein
MANTQRGHVTLEADGETYRLAFTTNAMCELEDAAGQPLGRIVESLNDPDNPPGMKTLRLLLWAALIEHHDGLTVKDAGGICDAIGMAKVGDVIGQALSAAFPDSRAGKRTASKPTRSAG